MKLELAIALLSCFTFSSFAQAIEFHVIQTSDSKLGFVYKQMGVAMQGRLKKFDAEFSFDPEKLATAKVILDINLSSLDAGSEEANDEISKKAWFDTQNFPQAKFVSNEIKALGGDRFQVNGNISLKGRTQSISTQFSYRLQNNTALFDGVFNLNRADFAIGDGAWADVSVIANEVLIPFHLLAKTAK